MRALVIASCFAAVAGNAFALDAARIAACKMIAPQINPQLSGAASYYNRSAALAMSCLIANAQDNATGPDTASEAARAAADSCSSFTSTANIAERVAIPPVPGVPPLPEKDWAEYALRVVVQSRVCFAYGPHPVTFIDPTK